MYKFYNLCAVGGPNKAPPCLDAALDGANPSIF